MWPLPSIRYEHVIIHIDQSSFSIGWLTSYKKQHAQLKAYQSEEFQVLTHAHLCNVLESFIAKHTLTGAFLSISVSNPLIYESLVRLSSTHASALDFQSPALTSLLWDFRYVHPLSNGDHLFYICGINRPTLFSYQLLASQNKLHLLTMSSGYNALIQAYKAIFGSAFRISQLAIDMEQAHYHLHDRLNIDGISRLLYMPASISIDREKEKKALISMIGLYYQERRL